MTTYILAGGNDRKYESYAENLRTEILKTVKCPVRVLSCFFSVAPEVQKTKYLERQDWFKRVFGEDVRLQLASPATFLAQVETADVIYFHGGENDLLMTQLAAYPDLSKVFKGKVVIGSSAGANYLSVKYWTRSKSQIGDGVGLVPFGVLVHYGSYDGGFNDNQPVYWEEAESRLRAALPPASDILRIGEGEFVTVKQ